MSAGIPLEDFARKNLSVFREQTATQAHLISTDARKARRPPANNLRSVSIVMDLLSERVMATLSKRFTNQQSMQGTCTYQSFNGLNVENTPCAQRRTGDTGPPGF